MPSLRANRALFALRRAAGVCAALLCAAALSPPSARAEGVADQAVALRQAGEYGKAAKLLLDRLADHPDDGRAHHELGVLYALHGQYKEAEGQFLAALRTAPGLAEARQSLAEVLRADERCAVALPHYKKLVDDDANRHVGWRGQILCHAQLGQWEPALAACDAVQRQFPGTTLGRWALGRCDQIRVAMQGGELTVGQMDTEGKALFAERRFAEAAVWLAMAVQTEPNADRAYRLAMARLGTQDLIGCQGALLYAQKLEPNHQPALLALATVTRALRSMGSGAENVDFGRFEETPQRAIARAILEGDWVLARQLVAAALPVKAAAGAPPPGATVMLLAGEIALRDSQFQKSIEWFEKVLKAQPKNDAARKGLADASFQLGRNTEARKLAELPAPPPYIVDGSDLKLFVEKRRAEILHQLRMSLDPGLFARPCLADQVAAELPAPPPAPEPVAAPPTIGKPGKGSKPAKAQAKPKAPAAKGQDRHR